MTKTAGEPRALPWAGMSQAFGLKAAGGVSQHNFSPTEVA
jgi:hypothetical protein